MILALLPKLSMNDRCDNWGMACRYRLIQGETASLEGGYRSPQDWYAPGAPPQPKFCDVKDAQEIESAVCVLDLYHHSILRAWHVYRVSEPQCIRLAAKAANEKRGRASGFDATLGMAYGLLSEALELPAVIRKDRARRRIQDAFAGVLQVVD